MSEEDLAIEENPMPQRIFALLADGEVFHKWYIDEDYSNNYMAALIYGLQSGPKIVDITDLNHEEIKFGWTQDGDSFIPPVSKE
jgi:hypothetical protein